MQRVALQCERSEQPPCTVMMVNARPLTIACDGVQQREGGGQTTLGGHEMFELHSQACVEQMRHNGVSNSGDRLPD